MATRRKRGAPEPGDDADVAAHVHRLLREIAHDGGVADLPRARARRQRPRQRVQQRRLAGAVRACGTQFALSGFCQAPITRVCARLNGTQLRRGH